MTIKREAGVFKGHAACDKCESKDNQGIYQAPDGTFNGFCFGCEATGDYGENPPELVKESSGPTIAPIGHIKTYDSMPLKDRFIPQAVTSLFGVKSKCRDGKELKRFYPYFKDGILSGYKVRELPKKFHAIGTISGNIQLFGQQCFDGGKILIITAGEEDALAAYRMTKWVKEQKKHGNKGYASVSLPRGAKDIKAIKDNLEWIERFDSVVFAVDQEDGDLQAAQKMIELLSPGKGKIARFPLNDASEMCKAKRFTEFYEAVWGAIEHKPTGLVEGVDAIWEAFEKREQFSVVPFPDLWQLKECPGIYWPGIISIVGGTGCGKSTLVRELQKHIYDSTAHNMGVITLEDSVAKCATCLLSLHTKQRLVLGENNMTKQELRKATEDLFGSDRFVFCGAVGISSAEDLYAKVRFMANARDCKIIFLDHITALTDAIGSKGVSETDKIIANLNSLVQELEICLILVAHVRKTSAGGASDSTYETGAIPTEDSIKGSGSLKQYSQQTLAIERNKQKDDAPTYIHLLKDREFGWLGRSAPLTFNLNTGVFERHEGEEEIEEF